MKILLKQIDGREIEIHVHKENMPKTIELTFDEVTKVFNKLMFLEYSNIIIYKEVENENKSKE